MENQSQFELKLNDDALEYLRISARWSLFIAVVGFVFIALILIAGAFMGAIMSSLSGSGAMPLQGIEKYLGGFYIAISVIYFFPIYYLYKYATDTRSALRNNDSELLTNGLKNLKSHHKFLGIFTLVFIIIYGVIFLGLFAAGLSAV